MEKRAWRVTQSSYAVDTKFLRLRKNTIELPGEEIAEDYFVRESRRSIIVYALTAGGEAVLIRQYKHGIGKELLELPADALDPGEAPQQTVARELRNETGYAADMEHAHRFIARDARRTHGQDLDSTESIAVKTADVQRLRDLVRNGAIESMPRVA